MRFNSPKEREIYYKTQAAGFINSQFGKIEHSLGQSKLLDRLPVKLNFFTVVKNLPVIIEAIKLLIQLIADLRKFVRVYHQKEDV